TRADSGGRRQGAEATGERQDQGGEQPPAPGARPTWVRKGRHESSSAAQFTRRSLKCASPLRSTGCSAESRDSLAMLGPVTDVPRLTLPAVDADWEPSAALASLPWQSLEPLLHLVRTADGSAPEQGTAVRAAADRRALYVRFDCSDRDAWGTHT